VSTEDKARSLRALPAEGEVTNLSDAVRRKLSAVGQLLRATGRDAVYDIKVIDIPQARVGLFERSVILITQDALALIDEADLQALVAHELGHEYVAADYLRASQLGDHNRLRQLELMCDAIAIVILHERGLDPSRVMASAERITRYNRKLIGMTVDERGYPTLAERRAFTRAVTAWVTRQVAARSSR
jgi:predicted Zn-dependent protease